MRLRAFMHQAHWTKAKPGVTHHHHYVPSVVNRSAVMDLHRSRSCATLIQSFIWHIQGCNFLPLTVMITLSVLENTPMWIFSWNFHVVMPDTNHTNGQIFAHPLRRRVRENVACVDTSFTVTTCWTVQCIKRPLATQLSSHFMKSIATAFKQYLPANWQRLAIKRHQYNNSYT